MMYDIFFISKSKNEIFDSLKKDLPLLKYSASIHDAQNKSLTEFFWVVWDDIVVDSSFKFDYVPDDWSKEYVHKFKNNISYDGIFLIPKNYKITKKEEKHRFFVKKKLVDIIASTPRSYDVFEIDTYEEYEFALKHSQTEMFWMSSRNIISDIPDLYFDHSNTYDRNINHVFIHQVGDEQLYNGVFLCSIHALLTKKEIEHRHIVNRKEWDIVASTPRSYDVFEIDTYEEYEFALKHSQTEMFWMSSRNIVADIPDLYFDHSNTYDRNINHVFIHQVGDEQLYNGVFLCSIHAPLTRNEVEHRHIVNRKEWDIVASTPRSYDVFEIDTYEEYEFALENSTTEMFWMSSRNIVADIPDLFFSHDNIYDRNTNHVFIHQVGDKQLYNGLFLCSIHALLTPKEIEHRHIVNRKEWDVVASKPKPYDIFEIDSYEEYKFALENSTTEMFWMSSRNIVADIPNLCFSHDNTYDRNINHVFIHQVNDEQLYNGVFLCSIHVPLSSKEIEHRHIVNRKEWDVVASTPRSYDVFEIDTYEEYEFALKHSQTEMFWMSSRNIIADIPDLYFDHSNTYDRNINHVFIHQVGDEQLYNGLFLCSIHAPLTRNEVEHRHIVNRKEWDVVASKPKPYDVFEIDSYEEYEFALENSTTEMFWIIPPDVELEKSFKFDIYFSHNQTYDRNTNHAYLNGKYHDGVILCSKKASFSRREFEWRFIANKKESPMIVSTPKPYDIVFISYQEPNADENYQQLIEVYPHAKRVHGVKGIHRAHIAAANLCNTNMFWIVDGDALLVDNFNFDYQVAKWDSHTVHVWRSQNPINGLVYGYGGVKLFPRELTVNMDVNKLDMTTSISSKFKAVNEISNITNFNTDPFNTWKSAFRECAKLSSRIIDRQKDVETQERLQVWCSVGHDKPFGKYSIAGAKSGALFGSKHKDNTSQLKLINDFEWLKEKFNDVTV